jgi:hypothetical protein
MPPCATVRMCESSYRLVPVSFQNASAPTNLAGRQKIMHLNSKFLSKIIEPSLGDFLKNELELIESDVAERSLCARLAMYFEKHMAAQGLTGYHADAEFNRKQEGKVKTIINGQMKVVQITCDLIVHSRGKSMKNDNLIALEMAKSNKSQADLEADRDRLIALTKTSFDGVWSNDGTTHPEHVCGYIKGLYFIIDAKKREATVESYYRGALSKAVQIIKF